MSWRPHNETIEDLDRERAAMSHVAKNWCCDVVKLSEQLYGLDWMLHRGREIIGIGEFKCRSRKYDTFHLSAAKWAKGVALAKFSGAQFYLFVQWPDEPLRYMRHDELSPCGSAVRPCAIYNSRGQNGDHEPGVEIDVAHFDEVDPRSMPGKRKAA